MSKRKIRQQKRKEDLKQSRLIKEIVPKSPNQTEYFDAIAKNTINFVVGPPGAGKSFIALYHGLMMLSEEKINKIIIIRPLVEVKNFGEMKNIGAIPGSLSEKLTPWLAGVFDNSELLIDKSTFERFIRMGAIEMMPLAFCRGRTFHNALVIVEEAQNISLKDGGLKMVLTRIGENCKMIVAGDLSQKDIGVANTSALEDALVRFQNTKNIGIIKLNDNDIIRSEIIKTIIQKYEL